MAISNNIFICVLTILPALIGSGLLLAGLSIHPLLTLKRKDDSELQVSIWRVTELTDDPENDKTVTWQKYIGSPSPMPIEIAAAMMLLAGVLSLSSFFKLRPATKLVSAHGVILAGFMGVTSFTSLSGAFSVHYEVSYHYPYWLAVSGAVILFIAGAIGHVGRQMSNSSSKFSISNLIFYGLCLGSAGLFAAASGLSTFGDSSQFCTITLLGLCEPFSPMTKLGLWEKCTVSEDVDDCTSWSSDESSDNQNPTLNMMFAFLILASVSMMVAMTVKFIWTSLRGLAATCVVVGLGASVCAQSVMASFLSAFYHTTSETDMYSEFRYQTQYYGTAFWISLAGVVCASLALISILGEESDVKNYVTPKKSAIYDAQEYGMRNRSFEDYSGSIPTNTLQYSQDSAIPRAKIEHYEAEK